MTPLQIALVRESFAHVLPIREQAAELFYNRLFEIAPETRALFKGDMRSQGAKLMVALAAVVNSLDRLDDILGTVQAMARRHVHYGVTEEQYGTVGEALLWTLQRGLGEAFTPDLKEAWATAYGALSTVMIAAAREEAAAGA
ncbi:MAG TPA: globin family protein [Azospirillum sp.]|nr:globin family protein [Azospirillum sp.]